MKISNELVEEICANVLAEHRIERDEEDATALLQVVWEMGTGIEYETAIQSIIEEAIKADRAQRRRLVEGARASVDYNINNGRTMTQESLTEVKRLLEALEG